MFMVIEIALNNFTLLGIDGKSTTISQFKGRVVVLVNTACECSYAVQYEGLEQLWLANRDKGLVIACEPSNVFGGQESAVAGEIALFCKLNYGVKFRLTEELVVKDDIGRFETKWLTAKKNLLAFADLSGQ